MLAGDFDSNGSVDLAVVNRSSNNVAVFLNGGDGTFGPAVTYSVGNLPWGIAGGDLDGDGDIDLAVVNSSASEISVLVNDGDGTFTAVADYPVGLADGQPSIVVTGDLDGDGDLDLAVSASNAGFVIFVLLNEGAGTFGPAVS